MKNNFHTKTLGELDLTYFKGISPKTKSSNGDMCLIPSGAVFAQGIDMKKTSRFYSNSYSIKDKILKNGDVLFNTGGVGTLGRIGYFNINSTKYSAISDSFVLVLRSRETEVLNKFLFYFLQCDSIKHQIIRYTVGTTGITSIRTQDILNLKISFPSLSAQKKIISLLEQADSLRLKRKQALDLLDEYAKSVFIEIFGDPVSNPKKWERVELESFGEIITGNTPSRNEKDNYSNEFIEWIKTDNILEDNLYLTKASEYLSEAGLNKARFVTSGAVLMACIAGSIASIGRVAIADRKVSFNQQINAIQPNEKINSLFLYWLLKNSRAFIQDHATRGMKRILTKGEFEKIKMIIPPIELQDKFAMIARETEVLKQKMLEQSKELDNQFQSLMQKSFQNN